MLPIYICEDEEPIRNAERIWLEKQILIENCDMEIALCTGSPEELLERLEDERRQGIYFLDVELKGASMDGFRLGQEIRKIDSRGFLIYVTAFRDLAFETFRYHLEALDYICKQDGEQMQAGLSRCLKVVAERVKRDRGEQQEYFTVKTLDVIRHIPLDEILYFATAGRTHRIELHAMQERLDFIGSMQELEERLGERFIRVHRAYLVRGAQIAQVNLKTREVVLKNGERCPFSRNMRQKLETLFSDS
ncbi:LytTR family DNA-binding domain-containing protein [Candidatus Merdisoma sp. JLR.KK006]|uniref:LytR/AlgR family response regulator transcription factor n=1 Tax=Candidatus Merdisoma sp. JLR.KK006 TaxID=3112626 RepID=UPI002FF3727E